VDGTNVEYVGEADFATKNELLGNSLAMLFPIQWDEPFGLVMVEAMACGTPVLALPGGSVPEIVSHGESGYICSSAEDIARRIAQAGQFVPADVRAYVEKHFSVERMVKEYIALYSKLLHIPIRQAVEDLDEEKRAIA
jgi:glycosyltransferase involved in cell wall biosynthesis